LQAAYNQHLADLETLPQARAKLLPTLTAKASSTENYSTAPNLHKYNIHEYALTLSQPILRFISWREYSQAKNKVKAVHAKYAAAEQDLIIRLSIQYFNVLKAQDNVCLVIKEQKFFAKHLEETRQRFKSGLSGITDLNEAETRHDHARAREIVYRNILDNELEKLTAIVGEEVASIAKLASNLKLQPPTPDNMEHWINTAIAQNLSLQAAKYTMQVSKQQISAERAGHLPSLQLDSSISRSDLPPGSNITKNQTDKTIGLTLSIPIFSGGAISSKTRQAIELYGVSSNEFEKLLRETRANTKQAYRGIITRIQQIKALHKTVESSTSALKATEDAFLVGTRTMLNVLDAEKDLLTAQNEYTQAHYDYLLESLKLKQAAGNLSIEDVKYVNKFLEDR
jgi:outer membrane protein